MTPSSQCEAWAWPRACTIVHQHVRPSGCTLYLISPQHPRWPAHGGPIPLRGHPAEQQPGQPPHRSGRTHTAGACYASLPRHPEQAVPLAGLLGVVLHGLGEILVEGHGLPPQQPLPAGLCGRLWLSQCRSRESCPEIHPQRDEHQPSGRCLANVPCLGTQLSGVTASNRRRTSDMFTPRAPSSTAAGSGGCRLRIWASTCWAVTWVFRRLGLTASSSTFFAAGVMRRRSFCMTSLIVGFFGTVRIGSGGASVPDPRPRAPRAS